MEFVYSIHFDSIYIYSIIRFYYQASDSSTKIGVSNGFNFNTLAFTGRWAHSVDGMGSSSPSRLKNIQKLSGPNDLATQSSKGGMKDLNRRKLDTN